MFRFLTAGESHGPALSVIVEGVPAGVPFELKKVTDELARRRLGYGRGPRMAIERDELELLGGVRFGQTLGSPISMVIRNSEWPKWRRVMAQEGEMSGKQLTEPRPGHADLAGMLKYGHRDARNVLERASARETAARTAAAAVAKILLREAAGIEIVSHVVSIGSAEASPEVRPRPENLEAVDASPVRCFDKDAEGAMVGEIESAAAEGDSLGGVFEVIAYEVPPGLGSYAHWDRRIDTRLGAALMSIHAIKGVEVGDGFAVAHRRGSESHDEIFVEGGRLTRRTDRAGGTEGGMTTGGTLRLRAAMKPLSTLRRPLATVDLATGDESTAFKERTDVCSVPAAAVVGEAMVALVLADSILEKFSSDTLADLRESIESYRRRIASLWAG